MWTHLYIWASQEYCKWFSSNILKTMKSIEATLVSPGWRQEGIPDVSISKPEIVTFSGCGPGMILPPTKCSWEFTQPLTVSLPLTSSLSRENVPSIIVLHIFSAFYVILKHVKLQHPLKKNAPSSHSFKQDQNVRSQHDLSLLPLVLLLLPWHDHI